MRLEINFFLIASENKRNKLAKFVVGPGAGPNKSAFKRQNNKRSRPVVAILWVLFLCFHLFNRLLNDAKNVVHVVFVGDSELELLKCLTHIQEDLQVFLNNAVFVRQSLDRFFIGWQVAALFLFKCVVLVFVEIKVLHVLSFWMRDARRLTAKYHWVRPHGLLREDFVLLLEVVDAIL